MKHLADSQKHRSKLRMLLRSYLILTLLNGPLFKKCNKEEPEGDLNSEILEGLVRQLNRTMLPIDNQPFEPASLLPSNSDQQNNYSVSHKSHKEVKEAEPKIEKRIKNTNKDILDDQTEEPPSKQCVEDQYKNREIKESVNESLHQVDDSSVHHQIEYDTQKDTSTIKLVPIDKIKAITFKRN
ncbi:hypothetical protein [Bacillus suaedae]|uniref:Uncharacterized protein n=1 Tax=Halalkalibacter suaedae TaxID=2822140 RepID=A0A940WX55_9BACI|nr:hypothetical protein [Bacillus suaedae]MBP3952262.1 hypothetical protein [Bacillus suaedae]